MAILFKTFLVLHIIAGTIGLISGTINLIRKKGGHQHKVIGLLFLYSMLTVSISAFVLSVIHPNYFLFIVSVFTFYMVASGTRYLKLKQLAKGQKPKLADWALTYFMLLFGILFIAFGSYHLFHKQIFGIVFLVFGLLGLRMVKTDFSAFRGKLDIQNTWLIIHIQRMIGAYIAALTAFLVVNNKILPGYIAWLLPTIILLPLIIIWTKKYTVKQVK